MVDWVIGYPSTVVLGAAYAAIFSIKGQWIGAVVVAVAAIVFAAGERWADRRFVGEPEWAVVRRAYVVFVLLATAVYVATTGDEFYRVTLPALLFVPAVTAIGRGLRAARAPEQ